MLPAGKDPPTFIISTQEKTMKSLFALLACAGIALTAVGCPAETTETTPVPDTTPDLGQPTPMDGAGSTTGAPDTGTSDTGGGTGASDTGATGETSDTGTEGAGTESTEGPAIPDAGGTEP
jgi:hypothetical protein